MGKFIDRTGMINYNNKGLKMTIIRCSKLEGQKQTTIDVKFEDGAITYNKNYTAFTEIEVFKYLSRHYFSLLLYKSTLAINPRTTEATIIIGAAIRARWAKSAKISNILKISSEAAC